MVAFRLQTEDGYGRLPHTYEMLSVLYIASTQGNIDAIHVIRSIPNETQCVEAILDYLGDSDIFDVSEAALALPQENADVARTATVMKAWASRQIVRKTLRQRGLATGE